MFRPLHQCKNHLLQATWHISFHKPWNLGINIQIWFSAIQYFRSSNRTVDLADTFLMFCIFQNVNFAFLFTVPRAEVISEKLLCCHRVVFLNCLFHIFSHLTKGSFSFHIFVSRTSCFLSKITTFSLIKSLSIC